MVREQGSVTGVSVISPQASGGLGLCAQAHQVVLSFSGVFLFLLFFTPAKQFRKCASNTIIYSTGTSEKADGARVEGRPHRVLLSYTQRNIGTISNTLSKSGGEYWCGGLPREKYKMDIE